MHRKLSELFTRPIIFGFEYHSFCLDKKNVDNYMECSNNVHKPSLLVVRDSSIQLTTKS